MALEIDVEKLAALIGQCADATTGACTSCGTCIGIIDGKQIQLLIQADEDDFMSVKNKFGCVRVPKADE